MGSRRPRVHLAVPGGAGFLGAFHERHAALERQTDDPWSEPGGPPRLRRDRRTVVGNKIQSVSHGRIAPPPKLDAVAIDGGGRVLTPGFIDAHVHMTSVLPRQ